MSEPYLFANASATFRQRFSDLPCTRTLAPRSSSCFASSSPMPLVLPVTTAVLPRKVGGNCMHILICS
eukprot:CAMPEP_0171588076 /NCGR_PEP_ID=MMETSP0961-20121227/13843_1 /TAXON_ID=87120 /ORGANISM="Aurantiochytrium limacinum, Strain ATCCMYA-1381" /LENGTH=67 /DNA_ID=CAMNT_0012146725 /DNA_START=279 /DNA_END=479 /DNA_ORIENTATION=+